MVDSATKIRLSTSQIEELVGDAFDGARLTSSEELTDGYFNAAFRLEVEGIGSLVLKAAPPPDVPVLAYEHDLMRAEVQAMRLAGGVPGVPVPPLRHVDFSRRSLPVDYLVMGVAEGTPWSRLRATMSPAENDAIERDLGRITAAINGVEGPGFGYLAVGPRFRAWYAAFAWMVATIYGDARRFAIEPVVPEDRLLASLERHRAAFDEVAVPALVHWDLWAGNVFVTTADDGPRVSGVIDFERALWGDPLMEFIPGRLRAIEAYEAGYGRPLLRTPEERLRRIAYNAYLGLVLVVEDGPRRYTDRSTVEWGSGLLERAVAMLEHGDILDDQLAYA
jgi:aminoglycoside phosphotransferase (APT) family kinase protein